MERLKEDEEEPVDAVSTYRNLGMEFFNKREYEEAIVEFNKVVMPHERCHKPLNFFTNRTFNKVWTFTTRRKFFSAQKEFESALKYDNSCKKCREYATRSEETFKKIPL